MGSYLDGCRGVKLVQPVYTTRPNLTADGIMQGTLSIRPPALALRQRIYLFDLLPLEKTHSLGAAQRERGDCDPVAQQQFNVSKTIATSACCNYTASHWPALARGVFSRP